MLKIFSPLSAIGIYDIGYRIASLLNIFIVTPLKQGLQQILFQKESEPEEQKQIVANGATYYYLLSMFCALAVSLFSREILMVVTRNKAFWPAWVVIPFICFSYVFYGLGLFLGWGLLMKNRSFIIAMNIVIACAVNMGLNFLFIPQWGFMGAAVATAISYIVWDGLKLAFTLRSFCVCFDYFRIVAITFFAGVLYATGFFIANTTGIGGGIAVKSGIILLYFPLLWLIGFFSAHEVEFVKKRLRFARNR